MAGWIKPVESNKRVMADPVGAGQTRLGRVKYCNGKRWGTPKHRVSPWSRSRFRAMVLQRGTTLDYSVGLMILEEVINGRTLVVDIKLCEELSASLDVSPMEKDWLTLFGHREMRTYHVGIVRCKCNVHLKVSFSSNGTAKGYYFGLLSWSHDFGVKGIFDKWVHARPKLTRDMRALTMRLRVWFGK
ncbi:hypothetical protein Sjap_026025 [Stephania japonica]|uniref:Uncharacterized protein n=1 Tax=Stephania japonica TaxID=461633 RepID=A0AAP0EAM4_9MAGN